MAAACSSSGEELPFSKNYHLMEGPWGEFVIKRADPTDYPRVVQHIQQHFMKDEPTCQLLGYTNDFGDEMEAIVRQMLKDNLSFLVEHKATGELAAVRVTYRCTRQTSFESIPVSSYSGRVLLRLVDVLKKMSNIFEAYGVTEFAELFLASTSPNFRHLGITTEIYKRSLVFLHAEGFTLAESMFTNEYTRRAAKKLGFQEICRLDYKEFIDDMGQSVFNHEELTDEHFAAVMVKML